jgi:hypothetical protein
MTTIFQVSEHERIRIRDEGPDVGLIVSRDARGETRGARWRVVEEVAIPHGPALQFVAGSLLGFDALHKGDDAEPETGSWRDTDGDKPGT